MELEFDLTKSIEENAGKYFEAAKKAKNDDYIRLNTEYIALAKK